MQKITKSILEANAWLLCCAAAFAAPNSTNQGGLGVSATVAPTQLQQLRASTVTLLDARGSQSLSPAQKEEYTRDPAAFSAQLERRKNGSVRITILH